jgi:hypothetical protein
MAPPRVYKDYPKTKIGLALHPAVVRELDRQALVNDLSRSQQAENYLAKLLRLDLQKRHQDKAA